MLRPHISSIKLILLVSLFITLINNQAFFSKISQRLDLFSLQGAGYAVAISAIIFLALVLLHFIIGQKYLLKITMIVLLLISAGLSYFSQQLGVIFDVDMIRNIVGTLKDGNQQEATELLSFPLIKHVFLYGVLPSIFVLLTKIRYKSLHKEVFTRLFYAIGIAAVVVALVLINYKYTIYFSRENRDLRAFITPLYAIGSAVEYVKREYKSSNVPLTIIGDDAIQDKPTDQRIIGVMVVGETARADHSSLNGYSRNTNPKLEKETLINFPQTSACGTSTAYSVPCMFSFLGRGDYSPEKAAQQTNALDVLSKAGVKVHWLDNNSSCKGVCVRTGEINLHSEPDVESPFYADGGIYDEALIVKMNEILAKDVQQSDVLFVLHILGSHGPKYYKRYPEKFSQFEPACKKATPQECTDTEIINAYDNTLLYTDHVLNEIIRSLKEHPKMTNAFMLYASDHGESLGEKGVYLHGLPYFLAPKAQTHVPMLAWFSENYITDMKLDRNKLTEKVNDEVSHDNLSHSLLGAFNVKTRVYLKEYDLFR